MRDHSAAAPPVARIVAARGRACGRPRAGRRDAGVADQVRRPRALEHCDAGVLDDVGRELAQDPPAGRAAARVDDAAARCGRPRARARGRRGGRRRSGRRAPRGRGSARAPPRVSTSAAVRRTRPRPALSVSSRCWAGRVVDRERGGEPALRPVGGGLGQRPGGDERHARRPRGRRSARRTARPRRRPPRRGRSARRSRNAVRYLRVDHAPSGCATTSSLAHDIPGHPERPARIRALEARDERATAGSARRGSRRRRSRARSCERGAPGVATSTSIEALSANGRRRDRRRHRRRARTRSRPRCTRPAARWRSSTRCSAGRPRTGVSRAAPARPSRRARARAMGFCFFGNVGGGGAAGDGRRTASSGC